MTSDKLAVLRGSGPTPQDAAERHLSPKKEMASDRNEGLSPLMYL